MADKKSGKESGSQSVRQNPEHLAEMGRHGPYALRDALRFDETSQSNKSNGITPKCITCST